MLASLSFSTPLGGVIAAAVLIPLAAAGITAARAARGRDVLQLGPPARRPVALALLLLVPLLVALAATGPTLRSRTKRHVRTDAQAMFVFDISRSMLASAGKRAPNRLEEARDAAIELRNKAIPDIPSGISTMTTLLLPHLLPTANLAVFNSGVRGTVAIEAPPPPAIGVGFPGTSFASLVPLRTQGYFTPQARKRIAILVTDGESGPYDPQSVASALVGQDETDLGPGGEDEGREPPVTLFIVRVGSASDRIYHPDGSVEAAFQPDPRAAEIAAGLARDTRGYSFGATDLSAATKMLRRALGSGPTVVEGTETSSRALAPYVLIAMFFPLAGLVWQRNLNSL